MVGEVGFEPTLHRDSKSRILPVKLFPTLKSLFYIKLLALLLLKHMFMVTFTLDSTLHYQSFYQSARQKCAQFIKQEDEFSFSAFAAQHYKNNLGLDFIIMNWIHYKIQTADTTLVY